MDTLDKGVFYTLGRKELDSSRFHHGTQNSAQFKTYGLFISGIFHLVLLNHSWPWVTEASESETTDKGETTVFGSANLWALLRCVINSLVPITVALPMPAQSRAFKHSYYFYPCVFWKPYTILAESFFLLNCVSELGLAKFFYKRPDSTHFRLCKIHGILVFYAE